MKPDLETVKKSLIPVRDNLEEDPENCNLEKVAGK